MSKYIFKYNEFVLESRTIGIITFDGYDEAIDYMLKWHFGQFRRFNKMPYANHPARVAKTVEKLTKNKVLTLAAFFHDILEDTKENWKNMAANFGEDVAKLVQELTFNIPSHRKDQKASFLIKKMLNMTDDALTIKLADRLDNVTDIMEPNVPKKSKQKAWDETNAILKNLEKLRQLKPIHNYLIKKIKEHLNLYHDIRNEQKIIIYNTEKELLDDIHKNS